MFMTYDSNYVDYVDAIIYHVNNKLMLMQRQYKNSFPQIFFRIAVLKRPQGSWENILNKTSLIGDHLICMQNFRKN